MICGETLEVDGDSWTCTKPAPCFTQHVAGGTVVWDNPRRPAPKTSKKRKSTLDQIASETPKATSVTDYLASLETAPPSESPAWSEERCDRWVREAVSVFRDVAHQYPTFTTERVWIRLPNPPNRRGMMTRAANAAKDARIIKETDDAEFARTYRTADGIEFPMNKRVPVYASLVFRG